MWRNVNKFIRSLLISVVMAGAGAAYLCLFALRHAPSSNEKGIRGHHTSMPTSHISVNNNEPPAKNTKVYERMQSHNSATGLAYVIDDSNERRNVGNGPTEAIAHKARNGLKRQMYRGALGVHEKTRGIEGPATEHDARSTNARYYQNGPSNVSSTLVKDETDNAVTDKAETANRPYVVDALELTDNDDDEFILVEPPSIAFGANLQLWRRFHGEGCRLKAKKPISSFNVVSGSIIKTE